MADAPNVTTQAALELSVVIPVYNGGEFFRATIESLLLQTLDRSRFEIVLVDDGSSDGSAEYCDELAAKHPGFVRVFHQANSGSPAGPRNTGARMARGEYVFFVDADDLVPPESFENMLRHAREKQLDIGVFKVDASSWNQTYGGLFEYSQDNCTVCNSRIMKSLGPYKLFKRSIIIDNDITFPEKILYEDLPFVLECYLHAERISIITDRVYYIYCARDDGGSISQGVGAKRLDEQVEGVEHYFKVASRYATARECPHIYTRGYRYLDYALPHIIDQKRDDLLEASMGIARKHYCDEVRSLMPVSNMMRMDVLTAGNREVLASMLNEHPLFEFTGNDAQGITYALRIRDKKGRYSEKPDFTCSLPPDCGWGRPLLDDPQVAHNLITRSSFNGQGATFGGRFQLLRSCGGGAVSACLRTNLETSAPASIKHVTCENVYDNVWFDVFEWEAHMPLSQLEPADESIRRIDFHLDVTLPNGSVIANRIGRYRMPGTFSEFAQNAVCADKHVLTPTETSYRNLSLHAIPLEDARKSPAALTLRKKGLGLALNVEGRLSFDNLPTTRTALTLSDDDGANLASTTLTPEGDRRRDRGFSGLLRLPKLKPGTYALRIEARTATAAIALDSALAVEGEATLRHRGLTYRLAASPEGASLTVS
ncbi:MAG: glycosyltransferase [Eggerthellaceae bacterium]|nr:glycosyltransferase [Eggerthellaceae bacterium]